MTRNIAYTATAESKGVGTDFWMEYLEYEHPDIEWVEGFDPEEDEGVVVFRTEDLSSPKMLRTLGIATAKECSVVLIHDGDPRDIDEVIREDVSAIVKGSDEAADRVRQINGVAVGDDGKRNYTIV